MKFSHLHVHTQYSLLDGAASINKMYKKAIDDGMPALAITDHGNMFGVFEFVKQAYNHKNDDGTLKVKPIVGCEFYLTESRHKQSFTKGERDPRYHQILLAKNAQGYKNLVKLTSLGFTEGMYGKYPRIDKELIHKYHEGLIATTCCLGALVPRTILKDGEEAGENEFKWWLNIFQEDYYVELQRHGIPEQEKVNETLLKFAKKYNVKVIASNDSHYVEQEDFNAHDILLCINTGEKQSTPALREFTDDDVAIKNKRFAFPNDQFFLKNTAQMTDTFKDIPFAIDNTNEIVDKIETLNLNRDILLPHFKIPANFKSQDDYLESITWAGAAKRYGILSPEAEERIKFELGVIRQMGFAGYFLIVSDFIKAGREMGVFIGPGRGSAAGSAVAYCIGITNIDPIKYNLLFERFLNPDRKSMPDIDTDFDDIGRQKVIDYVVDKYGKDQVAQIITYGTMAAKSSIADVARVMDLPLAESRSLTKMIPERPGISLARLLHAPLTHAEKKGDEKTLGEKENLSAEEMELTRRLRELYAGEDLRSDILKAAEKLEGSVRNTGVHAAGIIIAPEDLTNLIPVATAKDSTLLVTQIDGGSIESAGVIKMDFLGLKNLSIIKTALQLIKHNYGIEIDIDDIPLDDAATYELYQRADTNGTFQFESMGMQKYLRELKPDKFEDLIAMNALFRPGPMDYIPNYIRRKHGLEPITYDLPEMEEFLQETYGITVYQEQVMLLSQKLAGFSKGDADVLRKAMGKKDVKTLDKMYDKFIQGTSEKNLPKEKIDKIWNDWKAFAQYAFNKSHSTCYAFVAYQTAYLKTHYPSEYLASLLTHASSIEKVSQHMQECKTMGVKVLGPDINESLSSFSVNKNGEIRFGLGGLKGVGEAAIENIVQEREKNGLYKDIFDFIKRVNQRSVNKKSLEGLVYSGAFDCFSDMHRAQYLFGPAGDMNNLDKIIRFGQTVQSQAGAASNTLFGDLEMPEIMPPKLLNCPPWALMEQLGYEKDVTGMYMSGHPLENFLFELRHYNFAAIEQYNQDVELEVPPTYNYRLAGLVVEAQHRQTKTGKNFGRILLEDFTGKMELMLWSEDYARYSHFLETGSIVMVEGAFRQRFKTSPYEFRLNKFSLLESCRSQLTKSVLLRVPLNMVNKKLIGFLKQNIKDNPGSAEFAIEIFDEYDNLVALNASRSKFNISDELVEYLAYHPEISIMVKTL